MVLVTTSFLESSPPTGLEQPVPFRVSYRNIQFIASRNRETHACPPPSMDCSKCDHDAVMTAEYSGSYLCDTHFRESVESRVRRRIRKDNLLNKATTENPERWVIGLSGGKDSAVLTHILHETFGRDPRVELIALTIHEGIEGYRDKSLEASENLVATTGIRHEVVSYADEFGIEMDDVVETDPLDLAACAYCGVFRRNLLEEYAAALNATKLLTGHNLDDEAQTALMNFLQGDIDQIAKHFDASLGPFDDRAPTDFVPRAKPLRDIPEKEVALYAHLAELPVHMAECPHASEAFRGEIKDLLLELEEHHPGTRHSIMAGYVDLARMAADQFDRNAVAAGTCEQCGAITTQNQCRKCALVEALT